MTNEEINKKIELLDKIHELCRIHGKKFGGIRKDIFELYQLDFDYFHPRVKEHRIYCGGCRDRIYNKFKIIDTQYDNMISDLESQIEHEIEPEFQSNCSVEFELTIPLKDALANAERKPLGWQRRKDFTDVDGTKYVYGKKIE